MRLLFVSFIGLFAFSGSSMALSNYCLKAAKQAALAQSYSESDDQYHCKVADAGTSEPSTYWVKTFCTNNAEYDFEIVANETQSGCEIQQINRTN